MVKKSAAETSAPSKFHKQNVGMKAFLQTSGTAVYTGGTHLTSGLHVNTRWVFTCRHVWCERTSPSQPQLHNSSLFIRWLLSSSSRPQLFSYCSSLQPEVSSRGADWPQPKASTVKRLFDSYLWFCVCGASMHRDFFKLVFHILVVYLHKTHRNVVTFYPSLRFWSVYPPSKCKKVGYFSIFSLLPI